MNTFKGKARKGTLVIKIKDFQNDWIQSEPDMFKRNEALAALGSSWDKFMCCCSDFRVLDGRTNMFRKNYDIYVQASGLDFDKYVDTDADPADYIQSRIKFVREHGDNPVNITPSSNESVGTRIITKKMASGAKLTKVTHSDNNVELVLNDMDDKMSSFVTHLPVYMCALHITSEQLIKDTGISYFKKIRDKESNMGLYDYIVISRYLLKRYSECVVKDYSSTFSQIATMFRDIYITSIYFGDSDN